MDDLEIENACIIGSFLEDNNLKKGNSMIAKFRAFVEYSPLKIHDLTNVMIKKDTFGYGEIDIEETDIISLKKVHTNFKPRLNEYYYSSCDNALTIKGIAHISKGGKPYIVTIKPIL